MRHQLQEERQKKSGSFIPRLTSWWGRLRIKPKGRYLYSLDGHNSPDVLSLLSNEMALNTSSNKTKEEDFQLGEYPDAFTKALDEEGLLKYSNPRGRMPVLSVCYDFLDSELSVSNPLFNEKRYFESFQHLDEDRRESYIRLFSTHYPMEPLVDGLPQSVWLECVEPTLSILKALNSLKRRKSNLSIRKSSMSTVDSNAACHGDFDTAPFLFNPFLNGHQLRLMRVQFLALEGVLSLQSRNNQNHIHEVQAGGFLTQGGERNNSIQRSRRLRHYRPYAALQDMLREGNRGRLEEIIRDNSSVANND